MFNLTQQEHRTILFLSVVALIGLGINFAVKMNPRIERLIKADDYSFRLNLNQASLKDLLDTRLLNANLAKKIIAHRCTYGPFNSLEDLKEVTGIGDYRYEKLKGLFYVE